MVLWVRGAPEFLLLKSTRKPCLSHLLHQKQKSCHQCQSRKNRRLHQGQKIYRLHQRQKSCPLHQKQKNHFLKLLRRNHLHQRNRLNSSRVCVNRYENYRMGSFVANLGCVEYNPCEVEALLDPTHYLFAWLSPF